MPTPTKSQLDPVIKGFFAAEGLRGENATDLASALAEVIAGALDLLVQQAQVAPGIACSPVATVAPGRLL